MSLACIFSTNNSDKNPSMEKLDGRWNSVINLRTSWLSITDDLKNHTNSSCHIFLILVWFFVRSRAQTVPESVNETNGAISLELFFEIIFFWWKLFFWIKKNFDFFFFLIFKFFFQNFFHGILSIIFVQSSYEGSKRRVEWKFKEVSVSFSEDLRQQSTGD